MVCTQRLRFAHTRTAHTHSIRHFGSSVRPFGTYILVMLCKQCWSCVFAFQFPWSSRPTPTRSGTLWPDHCLDWATRHGGLLQMMHPSIRALVRSPRYLIPLSNACVYVERLEDNSLARQENIAPTHVHTNAHVFGEHLGMHCRSILIETGNTVIIFVIARDDGNTQFNITC